MRTPSAESAHRLGELALLTTAFVLPLAFYLRTYDTVAIKFAIIQWSALALGLSWLWQGLAQGRFSAPAAAWPALLPAAAYGAWMLARFAGAPHKVAALPDFLTQLTMLAAYVAAFLGFAGARSASRFCSLAVAAAWIVSAYALLQCAGVDPFIWKRAFGDGLVGSRAFSTLGNPYLCGAFLAVAAPLALTLDLDPEAPRPLRMAALILVPVAGLAALLTGSPMGAIVYALSCLVYAVLVPAALRTPAAMRTGAVALLTALFVGGAALVLQGGKRDSWAYSLEFKRLTAAAELRMAAERPLLGFGPGSFSVHYPRYRPEGVIRMEGGHNTMTQYPEQALLGVAVELGLVGAALWLWLAAAALWTALRGAAALRRAGAHQESAYAAGLAAAAAGGLVAAQVGFSGYFPAPGWFVWAAAGLAAGLAPLAARRAAVSVYPLPVSESVRRALYAPSLLAFAGLAFFPGAWLRSDVELNKGIYYAKTGQGAELEKAIASFENVAPGSRNWTMAQYFKGNALLSIGKAQEALAAFDRLQEQAPDYVLVHAQRGAAYAKLGDWEKAAAARARQAELDPLYVENLVAWAEAARAAGDLDTAKVAAGLGANLDAEHPGVKLQLAANLLQERRLLAGSRKPVGRGTARKPQSR
ncbi:MAG: hypothetical protein M0D55_17510 [Elusimicrobiota bacterium]|nr:MAG: hypothetical protein M0D55_17510 [Elusimicrobiota bacterium]